MVFDEGQGICDDRSVRFFRYRSMQITQRCLAGLAVSKQRRGQPDLLIGVAGAGVL